MSMSDRRFVALPCKLAPGAFSGEHVFEVVLATGESYRSLAPRPFCGNDQGQLVANKEPALAASGMVAARIVDRIDDGQILVEVPDGEVIAVDNSQIKPRPTPIVPPGGTPAMT